MYLMKKTIKSTYLFTYLASANLQRHTSWAIAAWYQFRIPSVVTFSVTCLVQRWRDRPFLRLPPPGSVLKTLLTGLELYIRATLPSHRRRCILIRFTTSMSSYILYSSWFHRMRLCRRKVHKCYVGFSSRRRLMFAHLTMSASKSQHHIIKPAIWETYINKSSFSKRGLFYSIAFLAQNNIY